MANISRKELLKPGALENFSFRTRQILYVNRKKLSLAGAILLLGVVLAGGVFYYQSERQKATDIAFFRLEQHLQNSPDDRIAPSLEKIAAFKKDYPDATQYNTRLEFARVRLLNENGQTESAIAALTELLDNPVQHMPAYFYTLAALYLVNMHVDAGEFAKAQSVLEELDAGSMDDFRRYTLARTYLQQKNIAKTRAELEYIINFYPNSALRNRAQNILDTLR